MREISQFQEEEEAKTVDFELTRFPSHRQVPAALDVDEALDQAVQYWTLWVAIVARTGHAVKRSLLVLRALTHYETGVIVAAPTTPLPEDFGGPRNWDYRYRCCAMPR
ncbi:hypothetical protein [Arthrobacter sp. OV608]|uniref:hypothetical protein n=1 Tax=Arthrobacter sp. OV608 TaxID=1882768 RepID=UPI000B864F8D|nr:hypothetical protein [Arthrobacter sp. OV608]